jgi:colanic acid/amylovoran biosynthesis glycosyltransferase
MKRSIAYLTSVYARAGDTFVRNEVEELRRLGWTVHTFSIRRADARERVSAEIGREQATTDYILERGLARLLLAFARVSLRSPARTVRAIRQARDLRWPGLKSLARHAAYLLEAAYLAERLRALGVELLHDHISMSSATVARLASTLSGVPFSMTVHGPHDFFAAEQWGLGKKIAASSLTVCISSFGRSRCMLFSEPEHWSKIEVVRCGLDRGFLQAPPPSRPAGGGFLCVGRLSPEKGQVLLVEAAARLRGEGIPLEIAIAGDGPSRALIERRARELGVEREVRLLGWQSSEAVRERIVRCRAVVLPSFAEGIPVVAMEAMALGRPVIATGVGGIPELVRHGENGWLVPAGSVEELAGAMREALRAPEEELARRGQRGRQLVLERHDLAVEVGKLAGLLEAAAQRRGQSP